MNLSIVTLHTDDPLIGETISSVYKTVKNDFEYILVDNNKNKERREKIKKEFPEIKILENPKNYGYARGINGGLKTAQGEFVLALNPDILIFEKTIDAMVAYMKKHPEVAVLGPKLLNGDQTLQYSCRRYPQFWTMIFRRGPFKNLVKKQMKMYEMHDIDHNKIQEVDWLCGGFLLTRKEVFEKIGYMDESYFLYFDDVDFCRRAQKVGRVVYYPEVSAVHSASYASKKRIIPFLIHMQSMFYYYLKIAFFPEYNLVKWEGWRRNK